MPPQGSLRPSFRRPVLGLLVLGGVMVMTPVGAALPLLESTAQEEASPVGGLTDPTALTEGLTGGEGDVVGDALESVLGGDLLAGLPVVGEEQDVLGLGALSLGLDTDAAPSSEEPTDPENDNWRLFAGANRPLDSDPTPEEAYEVACDGRRGRIRIDNVALILGTSLPDATCGGVGVPVVQPPASPASPAPAPSIPALKAGVSVRPVSVERPTPAPAPALALVPATAPRERPVDLAPVALDADLGVTNAPKVPLPRTGPGSLLQGPAAVALLGASGMLRALAHSGRDRTR